MYLILNIFIEFNKNLFNLLRVKIIVKKALIKIIH